MLQACEELGIGFVPWGPLGMGYLRSGFDRFSPANLAANQPLVDLLKRVAQQENATPVQVAPAWLLAQKSWIVPIPGTRDLNPLNESSRAIHVQLSLADLREVDAALARLKVHGGRMNEAQMRVVEQTV